MLLVLFQICMLWQLKRIRTIEMIYDDVDYDLNQFQLQLCPIPYGATSLWQLLRFCRCHQTAPKSQKNSFGDRLMDNTIKS